MSIALGCGDQKCDERERRTLVGLDEYLNTS